jgi:predicted small metal-binding protein
MKEMRCRDVGMDCDFVARGSSEQEVMDKAAQHARSDHGLQTIPPDLAQKVRGAIHEA